MPDASGLKACCARVYESGTARWLLGDSFHPGGLALTERLGRHLGLGAGDRVLDVASGRGTSALQLAERFGCKVVGVDYGRGNVEAASAQAAARGLSDRVTFREADAESLPFAAGAFDALVCECAFCTFPDKARAAREFARVLVGDGRIGLADLSRAPVVPQALEGLLAWVACIADARPVEEYLTLLGAAGFSVVTVEQHREALRDLVQQVRGRLLAAEVASGLQRLASRELDFAAARNAVKAAAEAVGRDELGYVLITAVKTEADH